MKHERLAHHTLRRYSSAALIAALVLGASACADGSIEPSETAGTDDTQSPDAVDDLEARGERADGGARAPRTSIFDRGRSPFGSRPRAPTTPSKPATPAAPSNPSKPTTPTTPAPPSAPAAGASGTFHVSLQGADAADGSAARPWRTIGQALKRVKAGTILVHGGSYAERLVIKHTGKSEADYLNLKAAPGEEVSLVGAGAGQGEGGNMIYLQNASYVRVDGFRIVGSGKHDDASGVRVMSSGHHLAITNNEISEIRGESAMGITIYGEDGPGITDLTIRGNRIHDCDPAPSEALTLNGNVKRFEVIANEVRDVNNIGIDIIGGETWLSRVYPSEGVISDNVVTRANSSYDGSAACIYVDGASHLVIERNKVSDCDYGIEVGAENAGVVVTDVVVRNNFIHHNYRGGIIFGGYDSRRGRVRQSRFTHNSLYKNNRPKERTRYNYQGGANGEIVVQYADNCELSNNILFAVPEAATVGYAARNSSSNMTWTNNLHFRSGRAVTGVPDPKPITADPLFLAPDQGDLHIRATSPAREKAVSGTYAGSADIDGEPRQKVAADVGADEL